MDILALNGSPRAEKGVTDILLREFLEGAREGGAGVECIYLAKMKIEPCRGCFSCWLKTPGTCVINDDMQELIKKVMDADLLVLATPVYTNNMTSYMKIFTERLIPLVLPFQEKEGDRYVHQKRFDYNCKSMLIAVSGFPDMVSFEALVSTVKGFSKMGRIEYIGEITKPCGEALKHMSSFLSGGFLKKIREAGKEFAECGRISQKTLDRVNSSIIPESVFASLANKYWEKEIDRYSLKNHGAGRSSF